MSVAVITGSAGLIGTEAARQFTGKGLTVVGVDNDMRRQFFGEAASTRWARNHLETTLSGYRHVDAVSRDEDALRGVFAAYKHDIAVVIHTAAQPSHDWAARDPVTDFTVNANGTLNVLRMTQQYCPDAPFIFCSTNKVYGDTPNRLPLIEFETHWEVSPEHPYAEHGIDESMSIDASRSEEHTSELQSRQYLVCRLLLGKKHRRRRGGPWLAAARHWHRQRAPAAAA